MLTASTCADHGPTARVAAFRVGQLDYGYSVASTLKDLNKLLTTNPDVQVNLSVVVNGVSRSAEPLAPEVPGRNGSRRR